MIRSALRYIDRGIAVFPVDRHRDKRPLIKAWPQTATLDPAEARAWWREWPDANIGVLCSWFWALDIDPRSGGDNELATLLEQHGPLPVTWEQRTGGGGSHYLFRHHRALESVPLGSLRPTFNGIDIKGNAKHYVLATPSRSSKGPYRWIRGPRDCEIADAPGWLLRLILELKKPQAAPEPVDHSRFTGIPRYERACRTAQRLEPAIQGSHGDDATFIAVAKIGRGYALTESETYNILASEWNPRCDPPWQPDDLRYRVERYMKRSNFPWGKYLEGRA